MSRISKQRFTDTFQKSHSVKKFKMPVKSFLRTGDHDYERFQPCFMSDDPEEFFTLNTPTPSEDIWKKFELLPTPPRSPKREPYSDFCFDENTDISSLLDDDIFLNPSNLLPLFPESYSSNLNLNSKLIQDCMWSGSQSGIAKSSDSHLEEGPASDCVDPTAVFPYPINDTKLHSLGTETPSDSEDEEVDVVSTGDEKLVSQAVQVDKKQCVLKTVPKNSPKSQLCVQRTNLCMKVKTEPVDSVSNSDCAAISVHNYSLPYSHGIKRERTTHSSSVVSHKRCKREQTGPVLKSVARRLKSQSLDLLPQSDSEECFGGEGKRTQHNVLERKRRNDLKDSFYMLRDQVPELDFKEKAPKVLILRKASEYVHGLRRTDIRFTKELNTLRQRNDMLQRKLKLLQHKVETDEEVDEYSIEY